MTPDSEHPPDAGTTAPGEWVSIGGVSTTNGQILIIANHALEPEDPGAGFDAAVAYTLRGKSRSVDGRIVALVVAPASAHQEDPRAYEDALIIRTWESSAYTAEVRTCDDAGHDGWCEFRIRLHDHNAGSDDFSDVAMLGLTMTDDEKRALAETVWQNAPDSDPT